MKLTRRELAAAVSATALATAAAQTPKPADEVQAARDRMKATSDLLAQQKVPMATEPAFQFKA
jgi:hypothetical protein